MREEAVYDLSAGDAIKEMMGGKVVELKTTEGLTYRLKWDCMYLMQKCPASSKKWHPTLIGPLYLTAKWRVVEEEEPEEE